MSDITSNFLTATTFVNRIFYTKFVDVLTAYLHTIFQVSVSSGSLFIVIKAKDKEIFLAVTILLLYIRHKYLTILTKVTWVCSSNIV
jgi:hypothetical protein